MQKGGLQLVEPAVAPARQLRHVFPPPAVLAQTPEPLGERLVRGDDGAAVAECAEILGRIEA
jgi:hypothetical protein